MPTALSFSVAPTNYVPANLRHDTNGWYVMYYAFNPVISGLERKRLRLNQLRKRCSSAIEFRTQVNNIINIINTQLISASSTNAAILSEVQMPNAVPTVSTTSINPVSYDSVRNFETLESVIDKYIKEKSKEYKPNTLRSYACFCKQFKEWIAKAAPGIQISKFTQMMAVQYMEFVYSGGNSKGKQQHSQKFDEECVTPTTYNNNLKLARSLFSWAIEKCYVKENPFEKIKTKKPQPKRRDIIPVEDRNRIYSYFKQNKPAMCIIMQMVYTALLRPIEITRVKVKQLDFENHCILMSNTQTKNGKSRCGRMDATLEALLKEHIKGANPEDFLFADGAWKCGKVAMSSHSFGEVWTKMRNDLKMPKEYQLYSLRDSGINNMLEAGVSPLDAMQAAGHSDLSMTTRYANHVNKNLINNLNQTAPSLVSTAGNSPSTPKAPDKIRP